jgi:hypothetical protein
MVNTSAYPVTVDGVRLDTLAYNIETKDGRDLGPTIQGEDITTGMRDGDIFVPNKKSGPGRIVLSMWVNGTDEDGVVPADSYLKYRQNLDKLRRIFGVRHRLLDVREQLDVAGAHIRQALCTVGAVIDPAMLANFPYTARMSVELKIMDGFWQDLADSNFDTGIGLLANTDHDVDEFALATAPMRDMWVVLDGPATNPKVIDNRTGHYAKLNGVVGNGLQWVVDTTNWTSKTGSAIAFTNDGTDQYDNTEFAGSHAPSIFGVTADPLGPQIRIEGSGFGANTRLRLRGKLKYL